MTLRRVLLLALCCAALGTKVQPATDVSSLLQTEMTLKAKETEAADKLSNSQSQTELTSLAPQADTLKEGQVDDPEAEPIFLRYLLQLFLTVVVADGLRRSRQNKPAAAVKVKCAPVDCTKPIDPERRTKLFKAAQAGDSKICKALLIQSVPVNGEDQSGNTLLHAAVKGGAADVVKLLLQKGAKVNAVDAWDDTPLHLAARHQSNAEELCDILIKHGAKVGALNAQEWTPLVVAGSAGKRAVCEFLLSRGATPGDVRGGSLPPMLRLLLQGEEHEAPEPQMVEKQSFDLSAM